MLASRLPVESEPIRPLLPFAACVQASEALVSASETHAVSNDMRHTLPKNSSAKEAAKRANGRIAFRAFVGILCVKRSEGHKFVEYGWIVALPGETVQVIVDHTVDAFGYQTQGEKFTWQQSRRNVALHAVEVEHLCQSFFIALLGLLVIDSFFVTLLDLGSLNGHCYQ